MSPEEGGGVADGLAIAGHDLFFSRCQDGTVGRANLDTRSVEQDLVVLPWPNCPQSLATARGRVYWAELGEAGESNGRIGSARLDGRNVDEATLVINSADGPFGLAAAGRSIFWSWGGSGGSPEYVARAGLGGPQANSRFAKGGGAIALMPDTRNGR